MMVRDYGHALTLQINEDDDGKVRVEYFVPKVFDHNWTPIFQVAQHSVSDSPTMLTNASEIFYVPRENAARNICSFIDLVPREFDIDRNVKKILQITDEQEAFELIENGEITPERLYRHLDHISAEFSEDSKSKLIDLIRRKKERDEQQIDEAIQTSNTEEIEQSKLQ